MKKEVEVVAKISDPAIVQEMMNKFKLQGTVNGAVAYLPSEDGVKFNVYPCLRKNQEFRMNVNEGKGSDGLARVVCSVNGSPIRPFWVKSKKNQRGIDREIDARFSLYGSGLACIITLNKFGLLLIKKIWLENHYEYIEVKNRELFSTVLKGSEGKFIFTENIFGDKQNLNHFKEATAAVVRKANSPDGGGPIYFIEKELEVVFHEEMPPQMTFTQIGEKVILSAGMTMRSGTRM